jgi:HK97 family phage major capsid protein
MTETDRRVRRALDGEGDGLRSRVLPLDDIEILSRSKGGDPDGRTVVAYAAAFGKPTEIWDQDGHYTEENHPHSFNKTVADRGVRFGAFYHHGRTLQGTPSERGSVPIGRPALVQPDGKGLLTHTVYNRTQLADDVLDSIRNGDPMGMSYTGAYLQSDPGNGPFRARSDGSLPHVVRKEIALIEFGPTPTPAYEDAEILGVRAAQLREAARAARASGAEPYQRHAGEDVQCPDCGCFNEADANYCDQCGIQLPDSAFPDGRQPYQRDPGEDVQCPACERYDMPDAIFCDQCGAQLPASAYEGSPAPPGGTDSMTAADGPVADTTAGRAASTARHEPVNGSHSHPHPAYGAQGGDATHSHEHAHDGDANHQHSHDQPDPGDEPAGGDMPGRSSDPATVLSAHFGWTPEQVEALDEQERSLLLASISAAHGGGPHERADVDNSTWDGNAAMAACKTASDYRAICAGEKTTGTPDERQHWALPHHSKPDAPPNANGVRNSLSRLPQTQDLANKQAAEAHLQAHMRTISPGGDSGGDDSGTSGRSETTPAAASGTGAGTAPEAAPAVRTVKPHEHSTGDTETGSERKDAVEGMTIEQRVARRGEIDSRILAISEEHGERAFPPEVQTEWDTLNTELDEHSRAIDEHERALTARRERVAAIAARQNPGTGGTAPGERVDGTATGYNAPSGTGERGAPALLPGRTSDDIYDVTAIRSRASSPEHLAGLYRDNALRAIERGTFPGSDSRERSQGTVERLLHRCDNEEGVLARRILVTGNPVYMRAYAKYVARLGGGGLSQEEAQALERGRAMAVGTGADGGFAVPFQLDPTVILTSDGAINPLRQISRVEQIVGKEFDLVTSTGVTVTRSNEATPMPDNSPTLAQPTIRAERLTGFIPFSMEIEQDWSALQSQMMMLLADAKDVEEAESFTNGNGTAPNAGGIVATLAASSIITGTGTTGTLAEGDLYALEDDMAPRFRSRAVWMASKTSFNAYRQLFTQTASAAGDPWVRPSAGTPPELLGYGAYENSAMASTHATGDKPIVLGDFSRGFLIIDRLGMSTEIAPMLFDPTTGRPTGQRGLVMFWRNNSRVIVDNAFRMITVP